MAVPDALKEMFPEFPKGPLTAYRNQASFDWRRLKLDVEGEDLIRIKNKIWDVIKNDDVFNLSPETLPMDEQRRLNQNRMRLLRSKNIMTMDEIVRNPRLPIAWNEAVFMYDTGVGMAYSITYSMFTNTVRGLGTSKHDKFVDAAENSEITACFALTEVSHGSNAKGMRTTATHDPTTKEFILNSADFGAAKCWVGLLGKRATHALVYAKLITSNGEDHGLHGFVVPIRCTRTLRPFAGIIAGDIGEKVAINGVDNGFIMFNSYRIPADNLLDRFGSVDDNGNYDSLIKDPNKRMALSFAILSGGRVVITSVSTNQLQKAITVAIRYSAVRKQFGPDNSDEEYPVIEYQQQQIRLLPYLAACYVLRIFSSWFTETHVRHALDNSSDLSTAIEIHGLSSSAKPVISWINRDGVQVCREACGGHGYLRATGIGEMRGENDANCTYEGENSILIQQTSNWLLSLANSLQKGKKIDTPMKTADFLNDMKNIRKSTLKVKTPNEFTNPRNLLKSYKWLVCYLIEVTSSKVNNLKQSGKDNFTVRNESQAFNAATLSTVFAEHSILEVVYNLVLKIENNSSKEVMIKLVSLFGAWSLEKHLATLYMGGFISQNCGYLLREGILELCSLIKPDAIALVDALAPPDFILNSVLGNSDGNVYQNLQSHIYSNPEAFSRPDWWQDVTNWNSRLPSKI